jgi:transposase
MTSKTLLADPSCLHLLHLEADTETIKIVMTTTADAVTCPQCHQCTDKVHSRYVRRPADVPWMSCAVQLELHVRRFICSNPACQQKIFVERLPSVVAPYARRTVRLADLLTAVGFALGGEAGKRLTCSLGAETGPDVLLRQIRARSRAEVTTPKVLGVDDFAFRKGRTYGTILVDLELHRPIDLLPDREAKTLEAWLVAHPGVQIITRDRAGAYAEGARKGAPNALQIADRFHVLRNLGEALGKVFHRHAAVLKEALSAAVDTTEGSVAQPVEAPLSSPSEEEAEEVCFPCQPSPAPQTPKPLRQLRYEEVRSLALGGMHISDISRKTGLDRKTVRKYLQVEKLPDWTDRRKRGSILDPYRDYLQERVAMGCHNATRLFREITKQGYKGKATLVRDYVAQLEQQTAPGQWERERRKRRAFSPTRLSWLVLKRDEKLSDEERKELDVLRSANVEVAQAMALVQSFANMLRERLPASLEPWLQEASDRELPELCRFAAGIERDKAAVLAALSHHWSNGPVEAQVQKLKLVKRQMFGRAKFDLLRQRVLHRI